MNVKAARLGMQICDHPLSLADDVIE